MTLTDCKLEENIEKNEIIFLNYVKEILPNIAEKYPDCYKGKEVYDFVQTTLDTIFNESYQSVLKPGHPTGIPLPLEIILPLLTKEQLAECVFLVNKFATDSEYYNKMYFNSLNRRGL